MTDLREGDRASDNCLAGDWSISRTLRPRPRELRRCRRRWACPSAPVPNIMLASFRKASFLFSSELLVRSRRPPPRATTLSPDQLSCASTLAESHHGQHHLRRLLVPLFPLVSRDAPLTPSLAGSLQWFNPDDGTTTVYNPGDIAWVLASTALVWIMIPGVGFFYSGLLRRKNALSMIWASMMTLAVVSFQVRTVSHMSLRYL